MCDTGRFFLINNILCRTEAADGSFSPSHIFGESSPLAAVVQKPSPADSSMGQAAVDSELPEVLVDPNNYVLHGFGIASGGVLLDSYGHSATDVTDPATLIPSAMLSLSKEKESVSKRDMFHVHRFLPEEMWDAFDRNRVVPHNEKVYRGGTQLVDIVAEAHYTLLSAVEPLNFIGTAMTPLSYPRGVRRDGKVFYFATDSSWRMWGHLCAMANKPLLVPEKSRCRQWEKWITKLEFVRFFQKRFPRHSLRLWASYHNYYPQLGGRRVVIRGLPRPEESLGVEHSFLTFTGSNAAHPQKTSFRETYTFKSTHALFRVCQGFCLSRKELRKETRGATKLTGLFLRTHGIQAVDTSKTPVMDLFLIYRNYFPCFEVRKVSSEEAEDQYDFASETFSCSQQFQRYCEKYTIVPLSNRQLIRERQNTFAALNLIGEVDVFASWHYLVIHKNQELLYRLKRFAAYLLKVQRRRKGVM